MSTNARFYHLSTASLSITPVGRTATEPEDRDECRLTLPKFEGVEEIEEARTPRRARTAKYAVQHARFL